MSKKNNRNSEHLVGKKNGRIHHPTKNTKGCDYTNTKHWIPAKYTKGKIKIKNKKSIKHIKQNNSDKKGG